MFTRLAHGTGFTRQEHHIGSAPPEGIIGRRQRSGSAPWVLDRGYRPASLAQRRQGNASMRSTSSPVCSSKARDAEEGEKGGDHGLQSVRAGPQRKFTQRRQKGRHRERRQPLF